MTIRQVEIETPFGVETHIIIEREDGSFESMPKATYEARLEAQEQSGTL